MSSCRTADNADETAGPKCETVGATPVRAHRPGATEGAQRYCATNNCPDTDAWTVSHKAGKTIAITATRNRER